MSFGRSAALQELEGGAAVLEEARVVALLAEQLPDRLPQVGVVVDDDDGARVRHEGAHSMR